MYAYILRDCVYRSKRIRCISEDKKMFRFEVVLKS